jgi:hypothetical protein
MWLRRGSGRVCVHLEGRKEHDAGENCVRRNFKTYSPSPNINKIIKSRKM